MNKQTEKPSKTLKEFIKSDKFATGLAFTAMIIQAKHTFTAYLSAEAVDPNWLDYTFSAAAAGIIDMIILFYTLRGKISIAKFGAYILACVNAYAYWLEHQNFYSAAFWAGIVFGCAIPALIFYFSDELIDARTRNKGKKKDDGNSSAKADQAAE